MFGLLKQKLHELSGGETIGATWRRMNSELVGLINERKVAEASTLGQSLVEFVDRHYRKDAPEKATSYNNQGMVFLLLKEYDLALQCFQDALAMRRRLFGNDHNEVALVLLNISQLYKVQAREIMKENLVETS